MPRSSLAAKAGRGRQRRRHRDACDDIEHSHERTLQAQTEKSLQAW